ncbi:MAG: hypothetical protein ACPLIG_00025 [Candidatus Bathyarchaeales archaeon]
MSSQNAEWIVIGYLVPSAHKRSYHVIIEGKPVGLIKLDSLRYAVNHYPPQQVEIQRYALNPRQQLRRKREPDHGAVVPIGRRAEK